MLIESISQFFEVKSEAIEFYRDLVTEALSTEPGSVGQQIRIDAINTPDVLRMVYQMVAVNQLWENQVDMYGRKLPRYKPDTIRKKAKLPYQTPDKLVNYTEAWSFTFMNHGLEIHIEPEMDKYFVVNTLARDYFQYIPDEYIGLTQENREILEAELDRIAYAAQWRYIHQRIDESPYADLLNALLYAGFDFSR